MVDTVFEQAYRLLASWEGPSSLQDLLGVVLLKAQDHHRSHPRWPVIFLPETIGKALGLDDAAIERLALVNLLFFCYADITDDAEDDDLSASWQDWGWPQAVNAGNRFLFACFQLIATAFPSSENAARLLDCYSKAGLKMTSGQHTDLCNSSPHRISMAEYLALIEGKTGASLSIFAAAPAILAGKPEAFEALSSYGENLGMVMQLVSDVREVWTEPIGPDLKNGRLSLPLLHALELLSGEERDEFLTSLAMVRETENAAMLRAHLERLGVRLYVELKIEIYRRKARMALEQLPAELDLSPTLLDLLDIPAFLVFTPMI